MALRIVQGKYACPARAGRIQQREQLLQGERAPVLVQTKVSVGVEDLRPGRAQALDLGQKRGEGVGVERVVHECQITVGWPGSRRARLKDRASRAYPELQMAIGDQIKLDLQAAMRAGEKDRVGALRLVLSELQKAAKEGSDDELAVLRRERKRRLEAAGAYREAGREELANGEQAEADLIGAYLPKELSETELRAIVEQAVRDSGAESAKDMGRVMKEAMAAVGGRADGRRVSGLVRATLEG
jgi:uncharacterized protein YqeY